MFFGVGGVRGTSRPLAEPEVGKPPRHPPSRPPGEGKPRPPETRQHDPRPEDEPRPPLSRQLGPPSKEEPEVEPPPARPVPTVAGEVVCPRQGPPLEVGVHEVLGPVLEQLHRYLRLQSYRQDGSPPCPVRTPCLPRTTGTRPHPSLWMHEPPDVQLLLVRRRGREPSVAVQGRPGLDVATWVALPVQPQGPRPLAPDSDYGTRTVVGLGRDPRPSVDPVDTSGPASSGRGEGSVGNPRAGREETPGNRPSN